MRFVVEVFGRRVLEVSTETEPVPASPSGLEATSGGQFEMGFSALRDGEVTCATQRRGGIT
ncbi:hypothetical protein [Mycobacterium sp.]|uniref:hypothetical protein n=1 Tax=Mycobacterium sp. TaxID=1785 RepID=UPI00261E7DC1|nr:hypothetical protein [Mycobacterium sp.]